MNRQQDELRQQVRVAKALNEWLFYKDLAATLEINEHSFYNFMQGAYSLSNDKAKKLRDIICDLIE